jgi:hypothetical protein
LLFLCFLALYITHISIWIWIYIPENMLMVVPFEIC